MISLRFIVIAIVLVTHTTVISSRIHVMLCYVNDSEWDDQTFIEHYEKD